MLKKAGTVLVLTILLFTAGCHDRPSAPAPRNELVVAMDQEMPGYFVLEGESYGYQYDLFKAYAEARGKELRVVDGQNPSVYADMLAAGEVDALTTLSQRVSQQDRPSEVPIYETSYVLLTGRKRAVQITKAKSFELLPLLREGKVLVSAGFKGSKAYNTLLDSLPANVYVSSRNSFDLIAAVGEGSYDFLICEMSEAQLGCALNKQVRQVYTFDEPISMSVVVTELDPELRADFTAWLAEYRAGAEYAMLNDLYFERGIVGQFLGKGNSYRPGRISPYDDIFKRVCEREGYDWRFISAIAYNESRFNPHVVSPRGARGLMQVMPRVARQFGMQGDLCDPEENVLLALRVLGKIEKSINFAPGTSQQDKMQIILAGYNAGVGHIQDARNLARKRGFNPDSWTDVSACLSLKSDPAVVADDAVKCGVFKSSRQTLAFVDKVVSRYNTYCDRVKR